MNREELYLHLKEDSEVLQIAALDKAFKEIDRKDFVDKDYEIEAYEDYALPIGYGQMMTKPTTVAFMLELLDIQKDESVLDVGSGSGWTTALISNLTGKEGEVLGLEIIPELVEKSKNNLKKYDFPQTKIERPKKEIGEDYDGETYDKILVSASAEELPDSLIQKLRSGGTMVIPLEDSIFKIIKLEDGELEEEEFPDFAFDPLI